MSGEKTEKPTQQRKKQARKEGTVARTPDLGAWAGLLAASIVVPNALRSMMTLAQHLLKKLPAIIARPEIPKMSEATTDSLMQASSSSFSARCFSAVRTPTRSIR